MIQFKICYFVLFISGIEYDELKSPISLGNNQYFRNFIKFEPNKIKIDDIL